MKVMVLGLALMSSALNASVPIQENFRCAVKGWDYTELDFQRYGDLYRVQATRLGQLPTRWYEFVIPVSACHQDATSAHPGVFSCAQNAPGKAVIQTKAHHYESVKIDVAYGEEENDYEPQKAKWPVWHLRIATITFSGGDFPTDGERYVFKTRVNNNEPGDFRDVCWLDGVLLQK